MTSRNRALLATGVWGLTVSAVLVALPLAVRDRLPDPIATHWSGSVPDGSMSFTQNLLFTAAMALAALALMAGIALHGRAFERRLSRAYWWGGLFGWGCLVIGMELSIVFANLDIPVWTQARNVGWHVVAVLTVAAAVGVLAGFLLRGEPDQSAPDGEAPPRLRLRPGQRSVWVSRVSNAWLVAVTVGAALLTVACGVLTLMGLMPGAGWPLLGVAAFVLACGLLTSSATVRITEDGVAVGFGPLGWPVRRIRLSKIERAWSEQRVPSQVGGWGIRGLPGAAAIMLRGGDCLILRYRSGGQLLISVDDAARGAALLNALIDERVSA
ncbi:hypothetical protein ACFXJ8_04230 [Nonomuraea sp. NPDC059194]|uniref:hypothetical protein n=1 Tax=Nonomuraea sp. NPDC059194 TaxID=3346764 RepID=UPI0036925DBF